MSGNVGLVTNKGSWNALLNAPAISNSTRNNSAGDYYVTSISGTSSFSSVGKGQYFAVGDIVVYNGSTWTKNDQFSAEAGFGTPANWKDAYDNYIISGTFSSSNNLITLNQRDGGSFTIALNGVGGGGGSFLPLSGGTMTGSITLGNSNDIFNGVGSASSPSYSFNGDTDTGLHSSSANNIGISTGGVERLHIDSAGNLRLNSYTPGNLGSGYLVADSSGNISTSAGTGSGTFLPLSGGTMSGSIAISNSHDIFNGYGTESAPSYSFNGDRDSGLHSPASNVIAVSTGGSDRVRINSNGTIRFHAYSAGYLVTDSNGNISVSASGGGSGGSFLPLSGGTMTGGITLGNSNDIFNGYGSESAPSYSFNGDRDTGMYSTTSNFLNLVTGGSDRLSISSNGNIQFNSYSAGYLKTDANGNITVDAGTGSGGGSGGGSSNTISVLDGSASAPSISFAGDTDTGIYRNNTNSLGFTTSGGNYKFIFEYGQFLAHSGPKNEPTYSFEGDYNTGFTRLGADTLGFSTAGSTRITVASNGNIRFNSYSAGYLVTDSSGNITVSSSGGGSGGGSSNTISVVNGSASAPSISFASDTDTGIYRNNTNSLGFTTSGGNYKFIFEYGQFLAHSGPQNEPTYSFEGDYNTGFTRLGADTLGFSTAGQTRLKITSGGFVHLGGDAALVWGTNGATDPYIQAGSSGDELYFGRANGWQMAIKSDNVVDFKTGIRFLNGGNDTLDTYDEGTFSPYIQKNDSNGSGQLSSGSQTRVGRYIRVGNQVAIWIYIYMSAANAPATSGNTSWLVHGLPFTFRGSQPYQFLPCGYAMISSTNQEKHVRLQINSNTDSGIIYGRSTLDTTNNNGNLIEFTFSGVLEIN